jgi:hypothetical protein
MLGAMKPFCVALLMFALVLPAEAKRRNRAERSLAKLWNETRYEDARWDARQLKGDEAEDAYDAARASYAAGKKRAKKATSLEELMGEIRVSQREFLLRELR